MNSHSGYIEFAMNKCWFITLLMATVCFAGCNNLRFIKSLPKMKLSKEYSPGDTALIHTDGPYLLAKNDTVNPSCWVRFFPDGSCVMQFNRIAPTTSGVYRIIGDTIEAQVWGVEMGYLNSGFIQRWGTGLYKILVENRNSLIFKSVLLIYNKEGSSMVTLDKQVVYPAIPVRRDFNPYCDIRRQQWIWSSKDDWESWMKSNALQDGNK